MTEELKHDMAIAGAKAIDAMENRIIKNPKTKKHYKKLIAIIKKSMKENKNNS